MDHRIIYTNDTGGVSILIPTPEALETIGIEAIAAKDVPKGKTYSIVDVSAIPEDRTFRNAWEMHGKDIGTNLSKAKTITHGTRRAKRTEEFAPLDIKSTIPSEAVAAEAARQTVREKYSRLQDAIDNATDVATLKDIIVQLRAEKV